MFDGLSEWELGSFTQFYSYLDNCPPLTRAEERLLAAKIQMSEGDEKLEAANELVRRNFRFLVRFCRRHDHCGLPLMDRIQECWMTFREDALKYDPSLNRSFANYAAMNGALALRNSWLREHGAMATSRQGGRMSSKFRRAEAALESELGRSPTDRELLDKAATYFTDGTKEIEPIWLEVYRRQVAGVTSLSSTGSVDEGGSERELGDNDSPDALEKAERANLAAKVWEVLGQMEERDQEILKRLSGMGYKTAQSLAEVCEVMGVSRERIRQVKERAAQRFRELPGADLLVQEWLG